MLYTWWIFNWRKFGIRRGEYTAKDLRGCFVFVCCSEHQKWCVWKPAIDNAMYASVCPLQLGQFSACCESKDVTKYVAMATNGPACMLPEKFDIARSYFRKNCFKS